MNTQGNSFKTVYKQAADAGLYVGAWLSVMSLCVVGSLRVPSLDALLLPLLLGLPFFMGFLMVRTARRTPENGRFVALWLFGIYAFIFGSLIVSLVTTLYLQFIEPDFYRLYMLNALDQASQTELPAEMAGMLEQVKATVASGQIPSRMEFVFSMMWSTCFFGAIASLPVAGCASAYLRRKSRAEERPVNS